MSMTARSRVHPYLNGSLSIPTPPSEICNADELIEGHPLTMKEALVANDKAGTIEDCDRPQYHSSFGHIFIFTDHPTPCCPYCKTPGHPAQSCLHPHAWCHLTIICIMPTCHPTYGTVCSHANHHLTDNTDKEGYVDTVGDDNDRESWLSSMGAPDLVRGWCHDTAIGHWTFLFFPSFSLPFHLHHLFHIHSSLNLTSSALKAVCTPLTDPCVWPSRLCTSIHPMTLCIWLSML